MIIKNSKIINRSFATITNTALTSKTSLYKSILNVIDTFLSNNPINEDTEKEIEKFVFNQFKDFHESKPSTYVLGINLDYMSSGLQKIIMDSMEHTRNEISSYKEEYERGINDPSYLNNMSNVDKVDWNVKSICYELGGERVSQILFSNYLRILSNIDNDNTQYNTLINVLSNIGTEIRRTYNANQYITYKAKLSKKNISYTQWWNSLPQDSRSISNDTENTIQIGSKLFSIIHKLDIIGHHTEKQKQYSSNLVTLINIPDRVKKCINKNIVYSAPNNLPMIVKPKMHSTTNKGGYLLNDELYSDSLIIHKNKIREDAKILQKNIVYNMVNNLSSTPFKINITLLDFIINRGHEFNMLIPDDFDIIDDPDKLTNYQKNKLKSNKSKKFLENNIIQLASTYRNIDIYFPVKLDQRGRIYCVPSYLNYQSTDLAKALLLFSKPGTIKKGSVQDVEFLKIFGANCFGNGLDKKSFKTRIDWVNSNELNIINYENGILLKRSKSKELFLSFCIEYARYNKFILSDDKEFLTYLPVLLDSTCNGFQHLALLSDETKLFKELNLSKSKKANNNEIAPKDFYTFILIRVHEKLNTISNDKSSSKSLLDSCKRIMDFALDRSMIKKTIMTIPYNASLTSMTRYVRETLGWINKTEETGEDGSVRDVYWYGSSSGGTSGKISSIDITVLVKIIRDIIFVDFQKIRKLTEYLKCVANICTVLNIPITWNLPTGLQVNQSYLEYKTEQIKIFSYSKKRINITVPDKNKLLRNKQVIALMPNLIHSLDATSVTLLYEKFTENFRCNHSNFYSIHDCFATTSEKFPTLISVLKSIYTILYIDDPYLKQFDKGIIDNIIHVHNKDIFVEHRKILFNDKTYILLDIDWVLNKNELLTDKKVKNIINNNYIVN